jgi:hypothetical protein
MKLFREFGATRQRSCLRSCSQFLQGRGWLAVLLSLHLCFTAFSAWWHSPTQDEVAHLPAGLAIWRFGHFDLYGVNPPLVRSVAALPLLIVEHQEDWKHDVPGVARRREWEVGADFVSTNGPRSLWLYTLARWTCLPFSALGLVVCWCWGRELINESAGAIAATLWCFSPNFLGHGALITPDVAATSLGLLASWRFQHWLLACNWRNAILAGISLGLALLAKSYWIILLGLWPLIFLANLAVSPELRRKTIPSVVQLCVLLGLALHLLNLGYGYRDPGNTLGQYEFFSALLSGEHRDIELESPGNRFSNSWLGRIPIPLPRDYVQGIDRQKHDFEEPDRSYLWGEWREQGWWYYYLVGLGVKVPLGTLILFGLGIAAGLKQRWPWDQARLLPVWLPGVSILLIASSETGMNHHFRYVFPVLPVLYLIAGGSACLPCRWPMMMSLAAVICGSLSIFPHSLSYFNLIAGGPGQGHAVLVDSNIDWGQDLIHVRRWVNAHPQAQPVTLAWAASYPSRAIGLELPRTPPGRPQPGWHLISVHLLHDPSGAYAEYEKLVPIDRVGFSFNIYHVGEDRGAD